MPDDLIQRLEPLRACGKIALAVSGGRDSVALMVLAALARDRGSAAGAVYAGAFPDVVTYSVDHGLRPEAAAECRQVAQWAAKYGFPHRTLTWIGSKPCANLQAAARETRYRLLTDAARQDGADAIVTAHHLEDQAETFLIRLARGSGARGLSAMTDAGQSHGMALLRPLLDVPRARLEAVLAAAGQDWIDDPSNASARFERVRIRQAAPMLETLGLSPHRLAGTARTMQRLQTAIDHYADQAFRAAVKPYAFGFASLHWTRLAQEPEEVVLRVLARLIEAVAGAVYAPRMAGLQRLQGLIAAGAGSGGMAATLSGCVFEGDGQRLWIYREAGRRGFPELDLSGGRRLVWDKRFLVDATGDPAVRGQVRALGSLGRRDFAGRFPASAPGRAIATVPAFFATDGRIEIPREPDGRGTGASGGVALRPLHPFMQADLQVCG